MMSGENLTLAKSMDDGWSFMDNLWSFRLPNKSNNDGHLFELTGSKMVKLFPGRKLDYELRHHRKQVNEMEFLTAVEFSTEDPYGKAVALLDLKSRLVEAKEKWMVLPGIIVAFIASNMMKKEGYQGIIVKTEDLKVNDIDDEEEKEKTELKAEELNCNMSNIGVEGMTKKVGLSGGGCGSGCGSGCGNAVKSSGCGGCGTGAYGGGRCGNIVKSGGCGSGCGGGCGNIVNNGGCGNGCGGGCGNIVNSGGCGSGCGGGCGGGCGSIVNSGGCGGCGAGCGGENAKKSGGGCGAGCGGGCGDCGGGFMNTKCGVDEQLNEQPNYINEAVAA